MSKRLLALAVALVALPATAQDDPGGASAPPPAPSQIDDADPGGRSQPMPASVTTDDSDLGPGASAPAVYIDQAPVRTLSEGRDLNEVQSFGVAVERIDPVAGAVELSGRPLTGSDEARAWAATLDERSQRENGGPLINGRETPESDAEATPEVAAASVAPEDSDRSTGIVLDPARPNPAVGRTVVTFRTESLVTARVSVFDLQGRLVQTAFEGPASPETDLRVELDLTNVAAGTYLVVLDTGAERVSQTIQVVR